MLYSKTIEEIPRIIFTEVQQKSDEEEDRLRITKASIRRALADIEAGRVYIGHIPEHLKK
jgi:hypothetical protein